MPAGELGDPVWHQMTDFPYDGRWYRQEQDFYVLRVDSWQVSIDGLDVEERRSIDEHRWWSLADLIATTARTSTRRELPGPAARASWSRDAAQPAHRGPP